VDEAIGHNQRKFKRTSKTWLSCKRRMLKQRNRRKKKRRRRKTRT